jgi:hypothetical protein
MSLNDFTYFNAPSPHILIRSLIDPETFSQVKFPDISARPGGRIGHDIYPGEAGWAETMKAPGWKEISSKFLNKALICSLVELFAEDISRAGATIDPAKIYYEPYDETRAETQSPVLSTTHDPHSIFARFDLQAIGHTYSKGVHVDWPRRLFGGVLFMTSAEDEGMTGGEFGLYSDKQFANDRVCHSPYLEKEFPVIRNTGVVFLNSNTAFHGPKRITRISGLRRWVYFSVSSRRDIWVATN